ncbi:TPA: lipopolysaccharide biosynthesis protein RfbH [Candidatus Woesearchaeota archaeon]|nr:lipopolysaccharide biosynthesis protein RfbH [Candidatus Woesearchaeota archaeon]HII68804.1 lipopolysaccharide biosynthesis protein RfbH [Candidatus Woesearchaeota archaeon]
MDEHSLREEIKRLIRDYYELRFADAKREDVPVSGKVFDSEELSAIVDAALDGHWTEGKYSLIFEQKLKEFIGVSHAMVVNSGSSANLLAFMTLCSYQLGERRIQKGDEVITVAAGFPTTINPIIQAGCIPVFCDINLGTYDINIVHLNKAISRKTKAIMLAHTLGNPFNVDAVVDVCKKHGLWLIEDNCDGLGSTYAEKLTGTFGDISTISFYPAHHITLAEGGAVCTNNPKLSKIARSIRDWGRDCYCKTGRDNTCGKRFGHRLGDLPEGYDHKYIYSELGYNLKNTDINIAIGIPQLAKLPGFIEKRKENFKALHDRFAKWEKYFILPKATEQADPSWFGFPLTLTERFPTKRAEFLRFLAEKKIATRLLFGGNITKQPYFKAYGIPYRVAESLANTDIVMNNAFWIGVSPLTGAAEIEKVISAFEEYLKENL